MDEPTSGWDFSDVMNDDYLMSFVTDAAGEYVAIHLDLQGTKNLIAELEFLKTRLEKNRCEHTHLICDIGPPDGLTNTKLSSQKDEVNQVTLVTIYGWSEERAQTHGLKPSKE